MSVANRIRRWQRKKKQDKRRADTAKLIVNLLEEIDPAFVTTPMARIVFYRELQRADIATLESIPAFLRNSKHPSVAATAIVTAVNSKKSVGETIYVLIRHYDFFVSAGWNRYHQPSWIIPTVKWVREELVERDKFHTWRLPVEKEREFIGLLLDLTQQGIKTGEWLVPFLIVNPDKTKRVREMLIKREVASARAMEVLLDDDIPISMQDGAL